MSARSLAVLFFVVAIVEAVALFATITSSPTPPTTSAEYTGASRRPSNPSIDSAELQSRLARLEDAVRDIGKRIGKVPSGTCSTDKPIAESVRVKATDESELFRKSREAELDPKYQRASSLVQSFNYFDHHPGDVDRVMLSIDAINEPELRQILLKDFILRINRGG